jgi:hypothetical protein
VASEGVVGEDHGGGGVKVDSHEDNALVVEGGGIGWIAREQGRGMTYVDVVVVVLNSEADNGGGPVSKVDEMASNLVGILSRGGSKRSLERGPVGVCSTQWLGLLKRSETKEAVVIVDLFSREKESLTQLFTQTS